MYSQKPHDKSQVTTEIDSLSKKHSIKSKSHKNKKRKHKKSGKHKKDKKYSSSSSSESTTDNEWIEKDQTDTYSSKDDIENKHDKWMSLTDIIPTVSKSEMRKQQENKKQEHKKESSYDPTRSSRELNPYWKDGGNGLPSMSQNFAFKKPMDDDVSSKWYKNKRIIEKPSSKHNRKLLDDKVCFKNDKNDKTSYPDDKPNDINTDAGLIFTEKDVNDIAAKVLKAEILGNTSLANELKKKLEFARASVKQNLQLEKETMNEVILTNTDIRGYTRPCQQFSHAEQPSCSKRKEKVETHLQGKRIRYFGDDDNQSLNQMFEKEKYSSSYDQNLEFVKMSGKLKNSDDTDDVFVDNIRNKISDKKIDEKNKNKAITQLNRIEKSLDNCYFCIDSPKVSKHLIAAVGENVYILLPSYKSLTTGHCLIVPIRHISCSTLLDEDIWNEIQNFRLALIKMFSVYNLTTVFFEHVINLHSFPHMVIQCIPLPKNEGEMAPIYFKKAILECETEWTTNKKLIDLKGSNVRKKIPKGLPYFFVEFGMENGFGHVIEEQKQFSFNFAQEIIGGILDLPHYLWRKPATESYSDQKQKVHEFLKMWKDFDITKK